MTDSSQEQKSYWQTGDYADKDEQLLDCIIAGVHNETTRRKLIAKDKNTTVDQALTMIRAHECTTRQMNDIQEAQSVKSQEQTVHEMRFNKQYERPQKHGQSFRKPNSQNFQAAKPSYDHNKHPSQRYTTNGNYNKCGRCGYNKHKDGVRCSAIDAHCNSCNRKGHFSRACRTRGIEKQMKELRVESDEDSDNCDLFEMTKITISELERERAAKGWFQECLVQQEFSSIL